MQAFAGHRGGVNCLAFRDGTKTLFSGSDDRCVKIWSLDDMAYVDTLYGAGLSAAIPIDPGRLRGDPGRFRGDPVALGGRCGDLACSGVRRSGCPKPQASTAQQGLVSSALLRAKLSARFGSATLDRQQTHRLRWSVGCGAGVFPLRPGKIAGRGCVRRGLDCRAFCGGADDRWLQEGAHRVGRPRPQLPSLESAPALRSALCSLVSPACHSSSAYFSTSLFLCFPVARGGAGALEPKWSPGGTQVEPRWTPARPIAPALSTRACDF